MRSRLLSVPTGERRSPGRICAGPDVRGRLGRTVGRGFLGVLGVGAVLLALALLSPRVAAGTTATPSMTATVHTTPTPSPSPQRTGDLGTKDVTGHVYDELQGPAAGIGTVVIDYVRAARFPPGDSGTVTTDAAGDFDFQLFLHDTDDIDISVSAAGFTSAELHYTGYQLWTAPPLAIALLPLRGTIDIVPHDVTPLPCEGDGEVAIVNTEPPGGEPLTITEIHSDNSYSQGDYGTGFTSDLSGIELPLTLAPGERVAFPVHYSAAGQSFPSRLTVRVRSTARNGLDFAVPYRGAIAGCAVPTPTATPLPPRCAGDCDGDGAVTIAELVRGVALALGVPVADCVRADLDGDGVVRVNELVTAVAAALHGCAALSTPAAGGVSV